MIYELTAQTFDEYIGSQIVPTLVDFWADWCGPCLALKPVLEELSTTDDRLVIASVDVMKQMQLSKKFNLLTVPTMILFSPEGLQLKRIIGYKTKQDILNKIEKYL